ncbi:MAG: hypothetical protein ACLFR2_02575 [Candidatus Kapaibacterium sp.]
MNRIFYILILIFAAFNSNGAFAQFINSTGNIDNQGKIIVRGQADIRQDTLKGIVEYAWDVDGFRQNIPQIVYEDIRFYGKTPKRIMDASSYVVSINNLFSDSAATFLMPPDAIIRAEGVVTHYGLINPAFTYGKVRLDGQNPQNVSGTGLFKIFELDNSNGADVVNGGGFIIGSRLELSSGQLRNSSDNNFRMGDSSLILRRTDGSLAFEPEFDSYASIRYESLAPMTTGPEIPTEPDVLLTLDVDVVDSLNMDRPATVNESLYAGARINTNGDTLTLTSFKDPVYNPDVPEAQIAGAFRRTALSYDSTKILFNNPYTYAILPTLEGANGITQLTFDILPHTQPLFEPDRKVLRSINITGRDSEGSIVEEDIKIQLGMGFRKSDDDIIDETYTLDYRDLVLQRWTGALWFDFDSDEPSLLDEIDWAYTYAGTVNKLGTFAIGLPGISEIAFRARILLEGAYIENSLGQMAFDLRERDLVPKSPPEMYPFVMSPNVRPTVQEVPDSVVDWVLIEFRKDLAQPENFYRTAFVLHDGSVVDLDGSSPLYFSSNDEIDSGGGKYYVIVRHRNHLPIRTSEPLGIYPDTNDNVFDLTVPDKILGGSGAMKLIDLGDNGRRYYGMRAGYFFNEGDNDDFRFTMKDDHKAAYDMFTLEGYLQFDYNLDGIVTTKDFNISWNNRIK